MPKFEPNYQGHLLISNPHNPRDIFHQSVILMVSHSAHMAIGLQINCPIMAFSLASVADRMGIHCAVEDPIYYGGNVNPNKIHMIHSTDWAGATTIQLNDDLAVTNDISVLAAMSEDQGPRHFRACLGYWIWEDGLLQQQLSEDPDVRGEDPYRWEIAPATVDTVFNTLPDHQWTRAIEDSTRHQVSVWF